MAKVQPFRHAAVPVLASVPGRRSSRCQKSGTVEIGLLSGEPVPAGRSLPLDQSPLSERRLVQLAVVFHPDQGCPDGIAHLVIFRKADRGLQAPGNAGQKTTGCSTDADDGQLDGKAE